MAFDTSTVPHSPITGRLAWDAIPMLHEPIVAATFVGTCLGGLALVAVIALQAWTGRLCPLTTWEQALRNRAGQRTYGESFIQHWLSRLIFFDAPWWAFVLAYTAFAGLVALCWWRWPPRVRRRP